MSVLVYSHPRKPVISRHGLWNGGIYDVEKEGIHFDNGIMFFTGQEGAACAQEKTIRVPQCDKDTVSKESVELAPATPAKARPRSTVVQDSNEGCDTQRNKLPEWEDLVFVSSSFSASSKINVLTKDKEDHSQANSSEVSVSPRLSTNIEWKQGDVLGEGAYGKVFAGLNQRSGQLMAVKQLKLDSSIQAQERQFLVEALQREISLYKTMKHRNIVGYIGMKEDLDADSIFIFLEYVSGGSIQRMLETFGPFSESLVRTYTRQLLLGLEYLHSKQIAHRDIKGANVLVDAHGVVKLADFGASKMFNDPLQTDGFKSIRGTIFWMAPEVIKGEGYGRRADVWSVGCTVIEMLSASHPWPEIDNTWAAIFHIAKANGGPPIPNSTSPSLQDFLALCFTLDPRRRPTASELLKHPFYWNVPNERKQSALSEMGDLHDSWLVIQNKELAC